MRNATYISARYEDKWRASSIRETLRAAGLEVSSSWLDEKDGHDPSDAERQAMAVRDLAELRACDSLVAYEPEEARGAGTGGRHVEFGVALELGLLVVLVGVRTNIFHYLPGVLLVASSGEAAVAIRAYRLGRECS